MHAHEIEDPSRWRYFRDHGLACATSTARDVSHLSGAVGIGLLKERLAMAGEGEALVLQWAEVGVSPAGSAPVSDPIREIESISNYLSLMSGKFVLPIVSTDHGRFSDSTAHVLSFVSGEQRASESLESLGRISNPIEIRFGQTSTPEGLLSECRLINPNREPGKIVLAMALAQDVTVLKDCIRVLRDACLPVVWICDLMASHGVAAGSSCGTSIGDLTAELEHTAAVHAEEGSLLAGVSFSGRIEYLHALRVCSNFVRKCSRHVCDP